MKKHPWLPALGWALFITLTSSFWISGTKFSAFVQDRLPPGKSASEFPSFWKANYFVFVKGWHAVEFGILTWLLYRWLRGRQVNRALVTSAAIAAGLAAADEYHQTFVRGRGGNSLDVFIDCVGIAVATYAIWARGK